MTTNLLQKFRHFQMLSWALLFLSTLSLTQGSLVTRAWAGQEALCPLALQPRGAPVTDEMAKGLRSSFIEDLKKLKVPAFLKKTQVGEIPVVLINAQTTPLLGNFMSRSFGTQIILQPNWNNDHGMLRKGNTLIDVDTPGGRGFGEINQTGLAWKPLDSWLSRRGAGSEVILEVSYSLTDEEMNAVDYYQRMRRAAVVRVPFTFGGAAVDKTKPNTLQNGGEHCFLFCKASSLPAQIQEMRANIQKAGVVNADALLVQPDLRSSLDEAADRLIKADPGKADQMTTSFILPANALEKLNKALIQAGALAKPEAELKILFNWMVGLDASLKYQKVIEALGVSRDLAIEDMNHPRATAVFIYADPAQAPNFNTASFRAAGKFYTWTPEGSSPLNAGAP